MKYTLANKVNVKAAKVRKAVYLNCKVGRAYDKFAASVGSRACTLEEVVLDKVFVTSWGSKKVIKIKQPNYHGNKHHDNLLITISTVATQYLTKEGFEFSHVDVAGRKVFVID